MAHSHQQHDEDEQPAVDWRTKPIVKPDFAAGSKPKPKNEYVWVFDRFTLITFSI